MEHQISPEQLGRHNDTSIYCFAIAARTIQSSPDSELRRTAISNLMDFIQRDVDPISDNDSFFSVFESLEGINFYHSSMSSGSDQRLSRAFLHEFDYRFNQPNYQFNSEEELERFTLFRHLVHEEVPSADGISYRDAVQPDQFDRVAGLAARVFSRIPTNQLQRIEQQVWEAAIILGLDRNPFEAVELRLNLMYGISVLGFDRTIDLSRRSGIRYFARYDRETLESVYENYLHPQRNNLPTCLVFMNQSDWNGAFYENQQLLHDLSIRYRVIIMEGSTENSFYEGVRNTSRLFNGPLSGVVIGGHGDPSGVQLGPDNTERQRLDLTDASEIRHLNHPQLLETNAVIVFIACSTGRPRTHFRAPIAEAVSNSLGGRRVFAPDHDSAAEEIIYGSDGRISSVRYGEAGTSMFLHGHRRLGQIPRRTNGEN